MKTENIFESTKESLDDVLAFLNERGAGLSHSSITEQIADAKEKIESFKKENPLITESELKDNKEITELFENIEFWANDSNFDVSTPALQNLDLIYAEAVSFACKEADRLIDQSEEEVLDDTLDAETEKEITESNNKLREKFNKTRYVAEKYLDDNADRFLMETYNAILRRDGAYFDFVEAEFSEDDEEFRWNNALEDLIFEESLYDKETLAEFNKEWDVSLTSATALYSFIESQKNIYTEAIDRFTGSLPPSGLVHFIEDLNSIDLENGRFSRENLMRVEELRNTREATKDSQVDVKNESIKQPNVTISNSENLSTVDLSEYKVKLSHFNPEDKERFIQKLVEYAMDSSAVELPKVEYSRENYNKYFNRGNIESPVESLKMGNNQFEKFNKPDRSNLIAAAYLTLKQPSVVIEKETYDEKSESFKPLHVYGKSFYRVESGNKRAVESVVVFKNAENIVIGSHNNDIDNFTKQIKTADQIIFADKNISRVITQLNEEVGNHVSVYGINTEPLNKSYNPDENLSTNNKPTFEENYNYAKKIFEGKTSGLADKVCNFDEMYDFVKEEFPEKAAKTDKIEALKETVSRMVYDNIDFEKTSLSLKDFDGLYDVDGYDLRCNLCDDVANKLVVGNFKDFDELQKYAETQSKEIAGDFLSEKKELHDKIEWTNIKPLRPNQSYEDNIQDYIDSIEPGDFLGTLKTGACDVEVVKTEDTEKDNLFTLNIYTLGKNDGCAGGGFDEGLTVEYDGSESLKDFMNKVEKASIKSIFHAGLARELVRENVDWYNKEQVEKLMEEKNGENTMQKNTPKKRISVTNEEWNALNHLAEAAKMDWFYEETYRSRTIKRDSLDDLSNAYLAQNLYELSGEERKLVNDVFSRAEIKIFNKAEEEKNLKVMEKESEAKNENRNVTSPDFLKKFENETVSLTKEEREKILQEVNPLEMSEKLKMELVRQQDFETIGEEPETFILTPENRDHGDMDAGEIAKLLNKNNLSGQPEITEEQAECMMRYLRYNDIALYLDLQGNFHTVDFSEDFTGEPGKREDTKGIVETVLDELDHGDGTEESYEHQKILAPLIRHYSYKPALTSDIMNYLKIDDKNLAKELEEWKGGFTDDNDFDIATKYSHLLKDKFGNLALESGDEIHKYTPDAISELVINDYNAKIKYDKNLDDVDRDNLQESVDKLKEVRADLRQVSWEQIENLFESMFDKSVVRDVKEEVEESLASEQNLSMRNVKEETVARLLSDNCIDLRGFHTDSDSEINELQFDSDFMNSPNGKLYYRIEGEKWNILERLAETIVQSKDTIDNISLDKQVQRNYDNELVKNETYKNCVKEGIIKSDFYLSKVIDPALKIAMDILPENRPDTTSSKLLEMAIKSIDDEYNREGVEPDFEQLETLIKGQDAVNYGIKSIGMVRPTAEEIETGLDNDWDLKDAIKGYTKAGSSELPDGIEVIERIDVMGTFNSDYEAALQAKKDGMQILPVKAYGKNLDEIASDYTGLFTDTPENRKFLKIKENGIEKGLPKNDKEIFNSFIADVQKEYRELKLFRQATINVLKNLPEEERKSVNRELRKRGAVSENTLAVVMKDAVREQLKPNKQQKNERIMKKDRDYGYER